MSEYSPFNARDKIYTSSAAFLIQMVKGETGHYELWRDSLSVWHVGNTGSNNMSFRLPLWMIVA